MLAATDPELGIIVYVPLVGASRAVARVGDEVTVLYDPGDPERAQLEGSGTAGRTGGGCGMALGGTFLVGGLAAFAGALALTQ